MLSKASTRVFALILLLLIAWAWLRMPSKVEVPALKPPAKPEPSPREPGAFPDE